MPDAQGNLVAGDPGYMAPGTGLIKATSGQQNVTPDTNPVMSYTPAIATATKANSQGYTPVGTVITDPQTVQGQLKNIIAADSPLMQQAGTRARQSANSRGLINSSMAVGAGHAAVIDAALPIAQQDAQTYYAANKSTADAQNAALHFGAAAGNQASLADAQLGTDVSKANAGMINQTKQQAASDANNQMLARLDVQTKLQVQQLDNSTRLSLATLDAQNRQLLQTNQSAASMFQQAVTNITNISTNPTLSQQAKDDAVASQIALLNEGLRQQSGVASTVPAQVQTLDLSQYFVDGNFKPIQGPPGTPGTQTYTGYNGLQYATQQQADASYPQY